MREPGRTAIGTWSGGRFLHFGEAISEQRLEALLRPGEGLDYVRGGLCRPEQFKALPIDRPGADNDLNELFDRHLKIGATISAYGARYSGNAKGVHDVHQNQGNIAAYRNDDGVWQDGGVLVNGVALLLRFQSQSWKTDDSTGHAR